MEVKNRIGMSPMGTNSAFTNGRKDAQGIDYFIERAKGGAGIIFMGCQMLNEKIAQESMEGYLDSYTVLPFLTSVCDGMHRYGTKIVCQVSPGTGRNAFPDT
ncbi:oxidoreductase [Lachnoclostridium sp. An169]|uniref:oxidoreductase n=1 Tax=Lachnoclostridium sp. An169 TaxID=1965569 RepID=UPI0023B9C99D